MKCYKACLLFADPNSLQPLDGQAVWVVEVKQVQAIMSTITIIVINIDYEECNQLPRGL